MGHNHWNGWVRTSNAAESQSLELGVSITGIHTYRSIKDYGWEETMDSMARRTFYDHVRDIESSGLSKAMLQNLKEHDNVRNVVPVLQLIHIDFASQRPDWYVEPSVEAA